MADRFNKAGQKLYPFSTWKHGINFQLVHDVCFNRMRDMENGYIPMDESEYNRLEVLFEKAGDLLLIPTPIAWLTGPQYAEAKRISEMGVEHRMGACIAAGREDLLQYC